MNKISKKISSLILSFAMILTIGAFFKVSVSASQVDDTRTFTISEIGNGEVTLAFDKEQPDNLGVNHFTAVYTILKDSGTMTGTANITSALRENDRTYKLTFTKIPQTNEKQKIDFTVYYNYDDKTSTNAKNTFDIPATTKTGFTISDSKNGSFVVAFEDKNVQMTLDDFKAKLIIDGTNKGDLKLKYFSYANAAKDKYEINYEPIKETTNPQEIKIEVTYKDKTTHTSEFILNSDGTATEGNIGSEYEDRKDANFTITKVYNGELYIKFNEEIRSTLTNYDFTGKYYVNGVSTGNLKITGVDENHEGTTGKDFIVYFDSIDATDKVQNITLLLFYSRETAKPVKANYVINADSTAYETKLSIEKVENFTNELTLGKITIAEKGKNTIYESSRKDTEYIKLELSDGFSWKSLNATVKGTGALAGASGFDVRYGTLKGEKASNILLIGLDGVAGNRKQLGSLEIEGLTIVPLDSAKEGNVTVRFSGAGIPYEKLSVANYTSKEEPVEPEVKFVVEVTDKVKQLIVNGKGFLMDTEPFIKENRLMLPVRFITVAFGVPDENVSWNDVSRTATIKDGDTIIQITLNSDKILINGVQKNMTTTAIAVDNRSFIPMRDLGDALGFKIEWDEGSRTATLSR